MAPVRITRAISIPEEAIAESFTRARGPGGQSVNTTDSAVMLRFDVAASGLPEAVVARLARAGGSRMTGDGIIVLRSEGARSQHLNRLDARERLIALVREACRAPKPRRPTKPSRSARAERVEGKTRRGAVKALRGKPRE